MKKIVFAYAALSIICLIPYLFFSKGLNCIGLSGCNTNLIYPLILLMGPVSYLLSIKVLGSILYYAVSTTIFLGFTFSFLKSKSKTARGIMFLLILLTWIISGVFNIYATAVIRI